MNLPTKSGDYAMPEPVLAAYLKLYPSAEHQFAQMVIWLECNPTRRPASPKSAPRFVANWFRKVPKAAPRNVARETRDQTIAALTGRARGADVIDMPTTARRVDYANFRAADGDLWGAEDGFDVDRRGPGGRQIGMG